METTTIYFKYKETYNNDLSEFYDKGGENKYIIPIYNPEKDIARVTKHRIKQPPIIHNTVFKKYLETQVILILQGIIPDTEIDEFLNFHLSEFTEGKHLFLIRIEQLINNDVNTVKWIKEKKDIILHWIEEKKRNLKKIELKQKKQKLNLAIKNIIPFKDLFICKDYDKFLLSKLQEKKIISYNDKTDKYVWEDTNISLSEFYYNLKKRMQLKPEIKSQDCARSLCKMFNINYRKSIGKIFQPRELEISKSKFVGKFSFITYYNKL